MRGVDQHQFQLAVREDMPDRLPIDAGGFHGCERASFLGKPRPDKSNKPDVVVSNVRTSCSIAAPS